MRVDTVADPRPGPAEVVVRVEAAGVNPADHKFRSGALAPFAPKTLPFILGMDIVGCVAAVGDRVDQFKTGDRVLAMLPLGGNGGYAEQVAVPIEWCAHLPSTLDAIAAAALPTPATTAVQWIEENLRVESGNHVLVTGATGAVGLIACFIAKERGAYVTAAVRKSSASRVRYANDILIMDDDKTVPSGSYDYIADTVGGKSAGALLSTLKPGGVLSTIATDPVVNSGVPNVTIRFFGCHADPIKLARLANAVAEGRLTISTPRVMKLSEAARAHELLERGGVGKMVLVPDELT